MLTVTTSINIRVFSIYRVQRQTKTVLHANVYFLVIALIIWEQHLCYHTFDRAS